MYDDDPFGPRLWYEMRHATRLLTVTQTKTPLSVIRQHVEHNPITGEFTIHHAGYRWRHELEPEYVYVAGGRHRSMTLAARLFYGDLPVGHVIVPRNRDRLDTRISNIWIGRREDARFADIIGDPHDMPPKPHPWHFFRDIRPGDVWAWHPSFRPKGFEPVQRLAANNQCRAFQRDGRIYITRETP